MLVDIVRKIIKKLIAGGIVATITLGTYTLTFIFTEQTGLKIPEVTVDAIFKLLVAIVTSKAIYNDVVIRIKQAVEGTTFYDGKETEWAI